MKKYHSCIQRLKSAIVDSLSYILPFYSVTKKALVVFSGGLDSTLATRVMQNQGFEVTALTFVTPFFDAEKAIAMANHLGIELIIKEITVDHLKIVKNPAHGHGKNMNPCLDCHAYMFRLAGELAVQDGYAVVATGEVMGQRPFSQNKQALMQVAKIAGMEGKVLRPLSAKHLSETEYEKEGIVDREKLLDLEGRSRKPQIALAKEFGIVGYPTPAGGCLLTEPGFSDRLKDLFEHHPEAGEDEINLLKAGRHIWSGDNKVIIGRDKDDNQKMRTYFDPAKMIILKLKDYAGPNGLIYISDKKDLADAIQIAAEKIKYYSLKTRELSDVAVTYWGKEEGEVIAN